MRERFGLDGALLKYIAVVLMTIDHAAVGLLYLPFLRDAAGGLWGADRNMLIRIYRIMRGLGRPAFPIFCFFLVEGFRYTRSKGKYLLRLLLFGIISEAPFDLGLYAEFPYYGHQNVFFELAAGLLLLVIWDGLDRLQNGETAGDRFGGAERFLEAHPVFCPLLQMLSAAAVGFLTTKLHFDYGYKGIALILLIYLLRFDRRIRVLGCSLFMAIWEPPAIAAFFPLIWLYNGERGQQPKYFFYAFYPLHLLLIYGLAHFLL